MSSVENQILKTTRNVISSVVNGIKMVLYKRILGGATETEQEESANFWANAKEVFVITFSDGNEGEMVYYNILQQEDEPDKEVIVAFESAKAAEEFAQALKESNVENSASLPDHGQIKSLAPQALLRVAQANGMYVTLQKEGKFNPPPLVSPTRGTLQARLKAIKAEEDPERRFDTIIGAEMCTMSSKNSFPLGWL